MQQLLQLPPGFLSHLPFPDRNAHAAAVYGARCEALINPSLAMADTCTAPSGGKPFSFGLEPRTLTVAVTLLASTPFLLLFVVPRIIRDIGLALGWALRRKTDGRRSHLLALTAEDDKRFWEQNEELKASPGDTGHDAQGADVGAPNDAEKVQKEWDGIVGFFHPFWYVPAAPRMPRGFY